METDHVKEFLVMAETLNYTVASEELFISQSTIFKHIRALENELGVTLFTRDGKKIVMTDYGKMFVHHARVILRQLDNYRTEVENNKEAQANILNLIDEYPNPEMTIAFRKAYPQFSVNQEFMKGTEDVKNSACELMILRGELSELDDDFDSIELTTDSVVVVTPNNHPFAGRTSIKMEEIRDEGIVGFSNDKSNDKLLSRHDVSHLCRAAGFEPNIVMSAFPGSEVARLVSQGGGISLLFKNAIKRRMGSQVACIDLNPEMKFPVKIYHKKGQPLSKVAESYINFAVDWYESYK